MFDVLGAVLGFIRRQVGLRTDAADKDGSVHSKIRELRSYMWSNDPRTIIASDSLALSADAERSSKSTTYVKVKEIVIALSGTIRVKFDLKHNWGGSGARAYGAIYKNGVICGTERSLDSQSYTTYSEDISVSAGDSVQLYIKVSSDQYYTYARNFRHYFDLSNSSGATLIN